MKPCNVQFKTRHYNLLCNISSGACSKQQNILLLTQINLSFQPNTWKRIPHTELVGINGKQQTIQSIHTFRDVL